MTPAKCVHWTGAERVVVCFRGVLSQGVTRCFRYSHHLTSQRGPGNHWNPSPLPRPGGSLCSQPGNGLEASPWTQARMSLIPSHWLTTSPPRVTLVLIRASPLLHPAFSTSFTTSSLFKHHQQTAQSGSISSVWSTILTTHQDSNTD